MRRQLDPVDLMVAVGLCTTVLGGYLMFMSTGGAIESASVEMASAGMTGSQWVQPALGQAIVMDSLLERAAFRTTAETATELNRAVLAGRRLQASPFGHLERIGAHAIAVEADHAARVQYVMGRRIVNFTARGIRAGILSPAQINGRFNRRMIRMAESGAIGMDAQFLSNREPIKGWEIVAASQVQARFAEQVQRRMGDAFVRAVMVDHVYREALGSMQEQLASVALASIRSEEIADRVARLAADFSGRAQPLPLSEPQSWPEVPVGLFFAAATLLIGLFFVGVSTPTAGDKPAVDAGQAEAAETVYRKTA